MSFTPWASSGTIFSFTTDGGVFTPIIRGTFGPYTSASFKPTRAPDFARATARFVASVDFPTPPLPLEIAMTCPSSGYATGCCAGTGFGVGPASMTGRARPEVGAPAPWRTPVPTSDVRFSAIPRNLQDLARRCENALAHVVQRSGDQRS